MFSMFKILQEDEHHNGEKSQHWVYKARPKEKRRTLLFEIVP